MASGDDPLADAMNIQGYQGLVGPNPYLQYQGKIPMAGFYSGQAGNQPPTDAQGNPIQSFVNANNTAQAQYQQQLAAFNAQQAQAPPPTPTPGTTLNTAAPFRMATTPEGMPAGQTSLGRGVIGSVWQRPPSTMPGQQQAAAPAAPTPPAPPDMRQAYLDALANPGKVNTPGAQMLPGTTPTGPIGAGQNPSVMQAFLAAHPQGGTPAPAGGGFSNAGFFNTLNSLQKGNPQ